MSVTRLREPRGIEKCNKVPETVSESPILGPVMALTTRCGVKLGPVDGDVYLSAGASRVPVPVQGVQTWQSRTPAWCLRKLIRPGIFHYRNWI